MVLAESHLPGTDIVDAVSRFGRAICSVCRAIFLTSRGRPGEPSNWVPTARFKFALVSMCSAKSPGERSRFRRLTKGREILFEAVTATGMPLKIAYSDVRWRVVNTDQEAAQARGLRGAFYKVGSAWRTVGKHSLPWRPLGRSVPVIRKRDNICIGQSDRFFVVIA